MEAVCHLFSEHPERVYLLQLLADTLDGAALERRVAAVSRAILGTPEPPESKTAVSRFL